MMSAESSTLPPPTVFIVDDDAAVLNAFSRLLRVSGYAVQTFRSAQSLLDQHTATCRAVWCWTLRCPD